MPSQSRRPLALRSRSLRRTLALAGLCAASVLPAAALAAPPADAADSQAKQDLDRAERMLLRLAAEGPKGPDGRALFPADVRVVARDVARRTLEVVGDFGAAEGPGFAEREALQLETWLGALVAAEVEGGASVVIRFADGRRVPLGGAAEPAPAVPIPTGPAVPTPRPNLNPHHPQGRGALAGRRIALVAGHGWLQNANGAWNTQRVRWAFDGCGTCRGITEDFFTAEMVSRHLIPLLENMGAEVVLVREPDHDTRPAAIIDDGDAAYAEAGEGFSPGASAGGYGDDYRVLAPGSDGRATYALGVTGERRLSLRWRDGENRPPMAQVQVDHVGGRTLIDLDQRRFGRFWLDLGQYLFDANHAQVSIRHGDGTGYLIADALKVGGGVFAAADKPWWQMAAKTYVPWAGGASDEVNDRSDVTIRPGYAEHVGADVYVSIHANASGVAGGSSANGITTYRYSCQQYPDHSAASAAAGCDYPAGSSRLGETVHGAIVERLRADYDPGYRDIGTKVANFGELRLLSTMPGILVETGFFDNLANPTGNARYPDNRSLHDPRWREAFAYGLASGLARYFEAEAPPPRPDGLMARNLADGTLEVSWNAVPGAVSYRLYTATTGRGWDAGVQVRDPRWVSAGLTPRSVYAFRVAALSFDGEGLASQAVAARFRGARLPAGTPAAQALFIGGYDRRDAQVQTEDNDLQTAVDHGHGLGAAPGLFFDGALDERVEAEDALLSSYALVVYGAGKDSTEHDAISAAMQAKLLSFFELGGALLASGEEIGWDLVARSDDPAEAAFLADAFGAEFTADDAETQLMTGAGPLAAVGEVTFDDGTGGTYAVRYPDVFAPVGDAEIAMRYPDGTAAAIATSGSLLFGVPLETVVPAAARDAVYAAAVQHLLGALPTDRDLDGDGADDLCERRYGFDDRDAADGAEDTDGDGRDLATECAENTDPRVEDVVEPDLGVDLGVADVGVDLAVDAAMIDMAVVDAFVPDAAEPDAAEPDAEPVHPDARLDLAQLPDVQDFPDYAIDRGFVARPDLAVEADGKSDDGGCVATPTGGTAPGALGLLVFLGLLGWRRRR